MIGMRGSPSAQYAAPADRTSPQRRAVAHSRKAARSLAPFARPQSPPPRAGMLARQRRPRLRCTYGDPWRLRVSARAQTLAARRIISH